MSARNAILALLGILTLILVALAPTGATAHGGIPHAHTHAVTHSGPEVAAKDFAVRVPAEVRNQAALPAHPQSGGDCGDRGCCTAGHCSGCATAIAPASWSDLRRTTNILLRNPDTTQPASLAREGPPRPPKSFV
jgi:hypothetical protein